MRNTTLLLVLLISPVTAESVFSQIRFNWGSPVEQWQNDMSSAIGELIWGHPRRRGIYCWHNGNWGIHRGRFFYPTHDGKGQPLSRTQKIGIGAAIGAGIGSSVSRNWQGAVIGGSVGAAIGAAAKSKPEADPYGRSEKRQSSQRSSSRPWWQQSTGYPPITMTQGEGQIPTGRVNQPTNTPTSTSNQGDSDNRMTEEFILENGTDSPVFAYNQGVEVCQLRKGETCKIVVPLGRLELRAHAVVRNIEESVTGPTLVYRNVPLAMQVSGSLVRLNFP